MIRRYWAIIKITKNVIPQNTVGKGDNYIKQYSDNIIAHQISSNVISDTNDWSHSFAGRKKRKMIKYNNQQQ